MEVQQLLNRLDELHGKRRPGDGPWRVVEVPHDYLDGTTHFTHVQYTAYLNNEAVTVSIGKYLTPNVAELLVLMRNNLPELIRLARKGLEADK